MGCEDLQRYLDQTMSPAEHREMQDHVAVCPDCREAIDGWERVRSALRARDDRLPPLNLRVATGAIERVRAGERPGRLRVAPIAMTFAGIATVVALWLVFAPPTPAPTIQLVDGHGSRAMRVGEVAEAPWNGRRLILIDVADRVGLAPGGSLALMDAGARGIHLRLVRGRMAAQVNRRVSITAGALTVRVIGTRFGVAISPANEVDVAVQTGSVEVTWAGRSTRVQVTAGEHVRFLADGTHARDQGMDRRQLDELLAAPGAAAANNIDQPLAETADVVDAPSTSRDPTPRRSKRVAEPDYDRWLEMVASGQADAVVRSVSHHLDRHPHDMQAWSLLADTYRKAERWQDAMDAYYRVINEASSARANRARFLAATIAFDSLGRPAEAVGLLRAYLAQGAQFRPLAAAAEVRLAKGHLALGETEKARALLTRLLEEHPGTSAAIEAEEVMERLP